ncbi:hypothetical protein LAC30SC_06685 [Lactobacillus amylovorus]|uniref:Uncharacterized protein n=1 Tax=Lactobacillus amylovorus TaxID=1604 RepID=F0TFG7_LACAM|nr:DUF2188 domain-containing protein [Lactobacillus amylovorus]ADZ07461.1 hypothetical protein LAC30SC_06685 [Lactobacillus amylovorus]MDB6233481.1 DUF2188 domain-containing protein [Lactobacillus amylovorus]MDB6259701.1 DUF2188 domain-containing protein [Lactobacillus amylovorus]RGW85214.1 DUF2188 domain-containing protein [Lactobacillus amylovorus]
MANQTWVSPRGSKWAVKQAGNSRASKIFNNKADALEYGRNQAIKHGSELIGQKRNGQINLKNSYGHDSFPPKG